MDEIAGSGSPPRRHQLESKRANHLQQLSYSKLVFCKTDCFATTYTHADNGTQISLFDKLGSTAPRLYGGVQINTPSSNNSYLEFPERFFELGDIIKSNLWISWSATGGSFGATLRFYNFKNGNPNTSSASVTFSGVGATSGLIKVEFRGVASWGGTNYTITAPQVIQIYPGNFSIILPTIFTIDFTQKCGFKYTLEVTEGATPTGLTIQIDAFNVEVS